MQLTNAIYLVSGIVTGFLVGGVFISLVWRHVIQLRSEHVAALFRAAGRHGNLSRRVIAIIQGRIK